MNMARLRLIVIVVLCLAGAWISGELVGRARCCPCRPDAKLGGFRLKALVAIRAGQEITMSYGDDACDCDREAREMVRS